MKTTALASCVSKLALALLGLATVAAAPLHARGRNVAGNGPKGGTYQREIERSAGTVTKNATATNAAGQTVTRNQTRTVDRAEGTVTGSATTTLPGGKTATSTVQSEKTETGRTTTAQATGPNGGTATYESTSTRTETGFTREAVAAGPKGGSATKDVTVSKEAGVIKRTVAGTKTPPKP
ncbi:hypothetical protein [Horticoccus sp. 23ND18S-11]|uniref:hypothetical protein n=1 Tax=Horticoccus sp. 23ND18S-11 TaxID=3391832 RepID=UPI0039C9AA59